MTRRRSGAGLGLCVCDGKFQVCMVNKIVCGTTVGSGGSLVTAAVQYRGTVQGEGVAMETSQCEGAVWRDSDQSFQVYLLRMCGPKNVVPPKSAEPLPTPVHVVEEHAGDV